MRLAGIAAAVVFSAVLASCLWEGRRGEPVALARMHLEVEVSGRLVVDVGGDAPPMSYRYTSFESFDMSAVATPAIVKVDAILIMAKC